MLVCSTSSWCVLLFLSLDRYLALFLSLSEIFYGFYLYTIRGASIRISLCLCVCVCESAFNLCCCSQTYTHHILFYSAVPIVSIPIIGNVYTLFCVHCCSCAYIFRFIYGILCLIRFCEQSRCKRSAQRTHKKMKIYIHMLRAVSATAAAATTINSGKITINVFSHSEGKTLTDFSSECCRRYPFVCAMQLKLGERKKRFEEFHFDGTWNGSPSSLAVYVRCDFPSISWCACV